MIIATPPTRREHRGGELEVGAASVILRLRGVAGHDHDAAAALPPRARRRRSRRRRPRARRADASARNACGVCTATRSTRSTVAMTRTPSTRFSVSATGEPGHRAVGAVAHRGDHRVEQRRATRAGAPASCTTTISTVGGHRGEPGAHRLGRGSRRRRPAACDRARRPTRRRVGQHDAPRRRTRARRGARPTRSTRRVHRRGRENCFGPPKRLTPTRAATIDPPTLAEPLASARLRRRLLLGGGPSWPRPSSGPAACPRPVSTSSRRASAASSSTLSANVSSDTRIWRARASIRFSPADRPLSASRIERFRTTSATW